MAQALDEVAERQFFDGVHEAERFLMGQDSVYQALVKLTALLDREGIAYAIVGGLALNEYGYRRVTVDINVLLDRTGLGKLKAAVLGRGYVERFPGSKGLRDTEHNVAIDVLLTGDYPGDGLPKPVAFPDPETTAVRGQRVALLPVERLLELKLASGMTAAHRLSDLADVIELIRLGSLPEGLAELLDTFVRDKYRELWRAAQAHDR